MEVMARILLLLEIVFLASICQGANWAPSHSVDQHETDEGVVNIVLIQLVDLDKVFLGTSGENRRRKLKSVEWDLKTTNSLLTNITDLVRLEFQHPRLYPKGIPPSMDAALQSMRSGRTPLIAITAYHDPYDVYQLVSIGHDRGGLPVEEFVNSGMAPLPKANIRIDKTAISYVPRYGELEPIDEVSKFLSKVRRWVGARLQLKTFLKVPSSPRNYTKLIHRALIGRNLHFYSLEPVPYPAPALEGALLQEAISLQEKYPQVPVELLFPEKQEYVIVEDIYVHSLNEPTVKLYEVGLGFQSPIRMHEDPEREGKLFFVQQIDRYGLETETPKRVDYRQNSQMELGLVSSNPLETIPCSLSITRMPQQTNPRFLRGDRFLDVRSFDIPDGVDLSRYQ